MFFVLTERVVKFNTHATGKYEPRTTNGVSWKASGPFTSVKLAERSASAALATHTCLAALVMSVESMQKVKQTSSFESIPYRQAVEQALKYALPE